MHAVAQHLNFRYHDGSSDDVEDCILKANALVVKTIDINHCQHSVNVVKVMRIIREKGMKLDCLDMDTTFFLSDDTVEELCALMEAGCCRHVKLGSSMGLVRFRDDPRIRAYKDDPDYPDSGYKQDFIRMQKILLCALRNACDIETYRLIPNESRYKPKNNNEISKRCWLANLIGSPASFSWHEYPFRILYSLRSEITRRTASRRERVIWPL